MIRVALVGIGGMGRCHFNCYKNIGNAELVAVCDVRTARAREIAGADMPVYESLDDMLEKEQFDMLDICTPSYLHREMSVKALSRGFHVLCEKPMSLNSADAAAIRAAAEQSGKLFMTAHVVRFMAPYAYLKTVVDAGAHGRLLRLDMRRISSVPLWSWNNWMLDLEKSGGTPIDLSIHDLDFIQYMLGQPDSVRGVYRKLKNNCDSITSELFYGDTLVTAEGAWYSYKLPFTCTYSAVFENGTLEYKDGKVFENGEEVALDAGKVIGETGINISGVGGYAGEIEYFADCIARGEAPQVVTPDSSLESVHLVERILENSVIL